MTGHAGQTITYDAIGNPLNYRDGMTMTWSQGRKLSTLSQGNKNISYTYDNGGLRLSKTVNGVKHTYLYENDVLVQETVGNSRVLDFSYTPTGQPLSVRYTVPYMHQTSTYYYHCNSRGDVIGLYNSSGTLVIRYDYDVWGKLNSIKNSVGTPITNPDSFALIQPLRYRGYYFDTESGLYYLQSRYYDPTTGRFINTDGFVSTGTGILGHNMFAYCNNNPVVMSDFSGDYPTYSGTLYGGGTFSHVPAHRLGYLGQIEYYYQDPEYPDSIYSAIVNTKVDQKQDSKGRKYVTMSLERSIYNDLSIADRKLYSFYAVNDARIIGASMFPETVKDFYQEAELHDRLYNIEHPFGFELGTHTNYIDISIYWDEGIKDERELVNIGRELILY